MRFAVDAHAIGRHLTGNEVYIRSLLNAFAAQERDCEIVAYVSGPESAKVVPSSIRTRQVAVNPFARLGFDLSMKVRQDQPDLLHVQYTAPVACPVPVVATVHDVSYLEHPEYFTASRAWQLKVTVGRTVKRAARILTGTETARASILKVYGELEEDKVVVVPYAAASEFRPVSREVAVREVAERHGIHGPFILSVGDIQPRKNHIGLIRAFARLVKAQPQLKHDLVLVGKPTWFSAKVEEAARESGVEDRIRFLGFVADSELLHIYNACDVFVFPSFYEGFGLPALEAMACGRAVVCSEASALPEVVDGAAILFDPYAVDEMVRAIADVLVESELRGRMERLGLQRAAHFNWQKTAEKTLAVFHEVMEQTRPLRQGAAVPSTIHR